MLSVRNVTELLSENIDEKLCRQWLLMTPNGTLLARSNGAAELKVLQRQVTMVTLAWQENDAARGESESERENPAPGQLRDQLRTLTIEVAANNIIATRVQPQLLLVLEGGVPPRRLGFEPKTTPEGPDDDQYPPDEQDATDFAKNGAGPSRAGSTTSVAAVSVLRLQRRKLEAMANAIADEFQQTGFQMPIEGTTRFF